MTSKTRRAALRVSHRLTCAVRQPRDGKTPTRRRSTA